jgi:hypothetical protein
MAAGERHSQAELREILPRQVDQVNDQVPVVAVVAEERQDAVAGVVALDPLEAAREVVPSCSAGTCRYTSLSRNAR